VASFGAVARWGPGSENLEAGDRDASPKRIRKSLPIGLGFLSVKSHDNARRLRSAWFSTIFPSRRFNWALKAGNPVRRAQIPPQRFP
jgi:hypothetical protein